MTYCTQQQLIDRCGETELIQLTDRLGSGTIDTDVIDAAIDDASAYIDTFIATRYTLPLTPVPSSIKRTAIDIARYYLYDDAATDRVREDYDNARNYLSKVASGLVTIGVDSSGTSPAQTENGAQIESDGRTFARSDDGFI